MKTVFNVLAMAIFLVVTAFPCYAVGEGGEKPGSSPRQPLSVSLLQLIATPDAFDGKYVRVYGFVRIEHEGTAIYLHREDSEHTLTRNGLWLAANDVAPEGSKEAQVKDRYALIEGRFTATKKGHLDLWSGSLEEITRMEQWEIRKAVFEARKAEVNRLQRQLQREKDVFDQSTGKALPPADRVGPPGAKDRRQALTSKELSGKWRGEKDGLKVELSFRGVDYVLWSVRGEKGTAHADLTRVDDKNSGSVHLRFDSAGKPRGTVLGYVERGKDGAINLTILPVATEAAEQYQPVVALPLNEVEDKE